jgi:hypothetical protein
MYKSYERKCEQKFKQQKYILNVDIPWRIQNLKIEIMLRGDAFLPD